MRLSRMNFLTIGLLIIAGLTFAVAKNYSFKPNTTAPLAGGDNTPMTTKQDGPQRSGQNKEARDKYELLLIAKDAAFKAGTPVLLDVSVRNNSPEVIYIVTSSSIKDNKIEVKDGKEEIVPLSDESKKLLESVEITGRTLQEIKPGEEVQYEYDVSVLYSLPAGDTYTIKLKRSILLADKTHFVEVESNPVKVTIY